MSRLLALLVVLVLAWVTIALLFAGAMLNETPI